MSYVILPICQNQTKIYENLQYYRLRLYDVFTLLQRQLENERFYATHTPVQPRPAAAQGSPSSVPTRRLFVPPASIRPDTDPATAQFLELTKKDRDYDGREEKNDPFWQQPASQSD